MASDHTHKLPELPSYRGVSHTKIINGKRFHLHQLVVVYKEDKPSEEMIVTGLDGRLELATPNFDWSVEYPTDNVPSNIEPQTVDGGTPVFGY